MVRFFCSVLIVFLIVYENEAKIFTQCELALELQKNDVPRDQIKDFVCLVEKNSLDTAWIGGPYDGGSSNYGLFQINDGQTCAHNKAGGDCNVECSKLIDDDITDDIACAKFVQQFGFNIWSVWNNNCSKNTPDISHCFGDEDVTETLSKDVTTEPAPAPAQVASNIGVDAVANCTPLGIPQAGFLLPYPYPYPNALPYPYPYPNPLPNPYPNAAPYPYPYPNAYPYPNPLPNPYPNAAPNPYANAAPNPYPNAAPNPYPNAAPYPYPNAVPNAYPYPNPYPYPYPQPNFYPAPNYNPNPYAFAQPPPNALPNPNPNTPFANVPANPSPVYGK